MIEGNERRSHREPCKAKVKTVQRRDSKHEQKQQQQQIKRRISDCWRNEGESKSNGLSKMATVMVSEIKSNFSCCRWCSLECTVVFYVFLLMLYFFFCVCEFVTVHSSTYHVHVGEYCLWWCSQHYKGSGTPSGQRHSVTVWKYKHKGITILGVILDSKLNSASHVRFVCCLFLYTDEGNDEGFKDFWC